MIDRQKNFAAALREAADKIQLAITKVNDAQVVCRHLRTDVDKIRAEYENDVEPAILELCSAMTETNGALSKVFDSLDLLAPDLEEGIGTAVLNLNDTAQALREAAKTMKNEGEGLQKTAKELRKALQSGESEKVRELLGSDAQTVSTFLSAPVVLDTTAMYPVGNYGSAMGTVLFSACNLGWRNRSGCYAESKSRRRTEAGTGGLEKSSDVFRKNDFLPDYGGFCKADWCVYVICSSLKSSANIRCTSCFGRMDNGNCVHNYYVHI